MQSKVRYDRGRAWKAWSERPTGVWTFLNGQEAAAVALGQRSHEFSYPLPQPIFGVGGEGQGEGARKCRFARRTIRADHDGKNLETPHLSVGSFDLAVPAA